MAGGDIALDTMVAGGLGVMGLIPVVFFLIHRRDRAPLWLGLFCFTLAAHFLFAPDRSLHRIILPDLGPTLPARLDALAWYASLPILAGFIRELYRLASTRLVVRMVGIVCFAAAVAATLLPFPVYANLVPAMRVVTVAAAAALVYIVLRIAWQRRSGWIGLLALMPALYPAVVFDVLRDPALRVLFLPLGLLAFVIAPVAVLTRRVARALSIEELRSKEERGRASELGARLRNQTKFIDDLVDSVPVALALRDPEGRYLFVNRTWEKWFSDKRERVVGARVEERSPPQVAARVREMDRAALERGPDSAPSVGDIEIDGRRYMQTRSVMADESGNVIGLVVASVDTTEAREQERRLREQMAFTRAAIDDNPNAMYIKDAQGRYVHVNDAWLKMLGTTREQCMGRTLMEVFPDDPESPRYHQMDQDLLASGQGWREIESERKNADGSNQWLIVRKAVLRDADGEVMGLIGTNTDITRLKTYEAELADRNEVLATEQRRLGLVIRASKVGIVDWDGRTHATYYSPRFREILGYPADADTSDWPDYFKVLLHPDDRAKYTAIWQDFIKGKGPDGRHAEFLGPHEHRLQRKDGSYVWVQVSGVALRDPKGFVTRWIAATTDITERREQEERVRASEREVTEKKAILETTLDNIDQGISMVDKDLRIMAFNRRFLELLELPADVFGRGFTLEQAFRYNALRGEYGPGNVEEQVASRVALARKFEPHAFERTRPNGQVLAIRGQPLPGSGGFVTTYTDVTEQKRAEEQLRQSVALREEVERMSRHDLKTPIHSVIAVARMLRESSRIAPEDAELLATVERAGYRILNMVNLSLDLFRMEQGSYEFRPQTVDLDEVASRVATDLQGQAASKNVHVVVTRKGTAIARAEELLCYSIFANLVKNAIEAAPEGTAVTIELDREDERAVARVHNDGMVPEHVRERFFQKYATAGKSAGLGLGTYSAHLLARVQGGTITLDTSEAAGTTLTLRLQAARSEEVRRRDALPRPEDPDNLPALPALRVLVADDDEFNRLVLRRHLPTPPLTVSFAVNGRAALTAAAREWPDVVLMDLEMPVMDGYQATRALREIEKERHRKRLLIVAISSNDEEAIVKRALAAGCDQYLVKPAPREVLWKILAGVDVPLASGGVAGASAGPGDEVLLDADLEAALPGFLESRREALEELPVVLQANDREGFRRIAHRLAGSFALYGFKWASLEAKALERAAADGEAKALAARAAKLRQHLDHVKIRVASRDDVTS